MASDHGGAASSASPDGGVASSEAFLDLHINSNAQAQTPAILSWPSHTHPTPPPLPRPPRHLPTIHLSF